MILQCQNLCHHFDNKQVLRGLNLEINQGEILSLVGKSGSGKSTALRSIAGLNTPSKAIIKINNQVVFDTATNKPPQERELSFVFQDYALFPHFKVKKNILLGLGKTRDKALKKDLFEFLTKTLEITDLLDSYPHELSGGQQQRISIARALIASPKLILFDEPFSSLDKILKENLQMVVKKLIKDLNIGALFVTHDITEAFMVSDFLAVLKDGEIVQCNRPEVLYSNPSNLYVAKFVGMLNKLKLHEKDIFFRPEDAHFSSQESPLKANLKESRFVGVFQNLLLDVGGTDVNVLANTNLSFPKTGYLHINKELSF